VLHPLARLSDSVPRVFIAIAEFHLSASTLIFFCSAPPTSGRVGPGSQRTNRRTYFGTCWDKRGPLSLKSTLFSTHFARPSPSAPSAPASLTSKKRSESVARHTETLLNTLIGTFHVTLQASGCLQNRTHDSTAFE
jgi:hypothetical protein